MKLASQYALRVALQTMKERCISLQQRLSVVEEENQILRSRLEDNGNGSTTTGNLSTSTDIAESYKLKTQVSELNRQNSQLSEHISMVANENRKLWSRLSKIDKNQNDSNEMINTDIDFPSSTTNDSNSRCSSGGANQNLIRSKTFTQHAPNPNLRNKIIPCHVASSVTVEKNFQDLSLEEVALENEIIPKVAITSGSGNDIDEEEESPACDINLGFTYLDVDPNDGDFNIETKKCIDGLQDIHREVLEQRNELNSAITILESRIKLRNCPDCEKRSKKPEMADKSLETDESITGEAALIEFTAPVPHIDILKEKTQADKQMKICPMCGKTYSNLITFDDFREHVETHFIDDNVDFEQSIDRNFEYISHAVGDF